MTMEVGDSTLGLDLSSRTRRIPVELEGMIDSRSLMVLVDYGLIDNYIEAQKLQQEGVGLRLKARQRSSI